METKQYIVALNKGVDYNQFWNEIESGTGSQFMPNRPVAIANARLAFERICEYFLTDEEANQLRNDPRVIGVEIPVENNPNVSIVNDAVKAFNYTKPIGTANNGSNVNWGLIRHSNSKNVYKKSYFTNLKYQYISDGTGVDVVINDSGIQSDHPEFTDANGNSRVQKINWGDYVPALASLYDANYKDLNGHGTNVAGIAVGKTYGWAKNANIYSLYYSYLLDTFEALILWHMQKITNRPTVVNMSWSLKYTPTNPSNSNSGTINFARTLIDSITGGNYRGTPFVGNTNLMQKGILLDLSDTNTETAGETKKGLTINSLNNGWAEQNLDSAIFPWLPFTSDVYNVALDEIIDNGIVVCQSAGNTSYKVDIQGGLDYDNYYNSSLYGRIHYHRGISPKSPDAILVGSLNSIVSTDNLDLKASYSCTGPAVTVFAAGSDIVSAGIDKISNGVSINLPYFSSTKYKQSRMSGTSMASPQVAGMCALYLQQNPTATPADVKSWIVENATNTVDRRGNDASYTNQFSTLGATAGVAFQNLQGFSYVKSETGSWDPVEKIYVKDNGTWKEVKSGFIKDNGTWKQVF
jgi:hypothetical protein